MQRWEYRTFRVEARGMFKKEQGGRRGGPITAQSLGAEGWGLAAAPTDSINGWTAGVILILKRPMSK